MRIKIVQNTLISFVTIFISELYDEWCLIENPYFYVNDMDCWPCSMVHSVLDLTGLNISSSFNVGIPYTRAENNTKVKVEDLVNLYWNNRDVFDEDAKRISSNNETFKLVSKHAYFNLHRISKFHICDQNSVTLAQSYPWCYGQQIGYVSYYFPCYSHILESKPHEAQQITPKVISKASGDSKLVESRHRKIYFPRRIGITALFIGMWSILIVMFQL